MYPPAGSYRLACPMSGFSSSHSEQNWQPGAPVTASSVHRGQGGGHGQVIRLETTVGMQMGVAGGHHVADHDAFAGHQLTDRSRAEPMSSSEDPNAEHEGGSEQPSRSADGRED